MATQVEAARLLTMRAARLKDAGERSDMEAGMAKLFASEAGRFCVEESFRIHGGYGYSKEYEIERLYRDAPLLLIGEGTSEIQRMVIGKKLLQRHKALASTSSGSAWLAQLRPDPGYEERGVKAGRGFLALWRSWPRARSAAASARAGTYDVTLELRAHQPGHGWPTVKTTCTEGRRVLDALSLLRPRPIHVPYAPATGRQLLRTREAPAAYGG